MGKTIIYKHGMILTVFLIVMFSCEKEVSDYRDTYTGTWNFKVNKTQVNTDSIGYYHHDSLTFIGEIAYGESDDEILIQYTRENSITLTMAEDGELSDFPTQYSSGKFLSIDSLNLYLRWGGIGGGTTHQIEGLKR